MKISIDDIKNSKNQSLLIKYSDEVSALPTEELVEAELIFSAFGSHINVKGEIVANVKLQCDRCLKEFVEKTQVDVDETYMLGRLNSEQGQEIELKEGDFVTELNGEKGIDIEDLIYQSVTLSLPNPSVCDINCIGGPEMEKYMKKEVTDPRLDIFKHMKIKEEGK